MKIVSDKRVQVERVRNLVKMVPFRHSRPAAARQGVNWYLGISQPVSRQAVKLPKHTKL